MCIKFLCVFGSHNFKSLSERFLQEMFLTAPLPLPPAARRHAHNSPRLPGAACKDSMRHSHSTVEDLLATSVHKHGTHMQDLAAPVFPDSSGGGGTVGLPPRGFATPQHDFHKKAPAWMCHEPREHLLHFRLASAQRICGRRATFSSPSHQEDVGLMLSAADHP